MASAAHHARWQLALAAYVITLAATPVCGQLYLVELQLDPLDSKVRMQLDFEGGDFPPRDVTLSPQKDGTTEPTLFGDPSDTAPWGGTLNGVYDVSNERFQLIGAEIVPWVTGDYCPGPLEGQSDHECPEAGEPTGQGHFPGQMAYSLSAEALELDDPGAVHVTMREALFRMSGPMTDIQAGASVDTKHWHWSPEGWSIAVDGTGSASELQPHDVDEFVLDGLVAHNENDAESDAVDPPSSFAGILDVDDQQVMLRLPIYIPLLFVDETLGPHSGPNFRVTFTGNLDAAGVLGAELLPGDANNDGVVNGLDVNIVSVNFGLGADHAHDPQLREPHEYHPEYATFFDGDFNGDSVVDQADLAILAEQLVEPAGGVGGIVPEPTSGVLGLCATLATLLIPRRHRVVLTQPSIDRIV